MRQDQIDEIVQRAFPDGRVVAVQSLTGGVSADVRRLQVSVANEGLRYVVLRILDSSRAPRDAEQEFLLLRALHHQGLPVPEPLLADAAGSEPGQPWLLMDYVAGTTTIPLHQTEARIDSMAAGLAAIHTSPLTHLPALPRRDDPLPEVFEYLPQGAAWSDVEQRLRSGAWAGYEGKPVLLHGDFWPENLLWRDGELVAMLDWEDAAIGDPLSDVACCALELRYKFGVNGSERLLRAYGRLCPVDAERLALWQIYVAAAAAHFMGQWGLPVRREAHMRNQALATIREACLALP